MIIVVDSSFGLWFVISARFLQGMWAGGSGVVSSAYIAEVLPKDKSMAEVNMLTIANILGMPIGPIIGILISNINI